MPEEQTPTLKDLARLLATVGCDEFHEEALATARWLVDQSPVARELHAELVAKEGEAPSPLELVRLMCAVASGAKMPETAETARRLIAQMPVATERFAELSRIAEDADKAPVKPGRWMWIEDYDRQLDRLLSAPDDWQDPDEVLDPTHDWGYDYEALFRLCRARLARSRGAGKRRLATVCEKLRRSAEVNRQLPDYGRRFDRLREWLSELRHVDDALGSLEEMALLLRTVQPPEGETE